MLARKTSASGASDSATGQKIAKQTGQAYHCQTKAASIIREVPKLVLDQQEDLMEECPTECEDDKCIDSLSKVIEKFEIDCSAGLKNVEVKGRLKEHIDFWQKIGASNFILSVINEGYRLVFKDVPPTRDML